MIDLNTDSVGGWLLDQAAVARIQIVGINSAGSARHASGSAPARRSSRVCSTAMLWPSRTAAQEPFDVKSFMSPSPGEDRGLPQNSGVRSQESEAPTASESPTAPSCLVQSFCPLLLVSKRT